MTVAEDNDSIVELTRDSLGNVLSESQTVGKKRATKEEAIPEAVTKVITSTFDNMSNRTHIDYPHNPGSPPVDDHYVDTWHDILGRPDTIQFDGGAVASYNCVGAGYRLWRKELANGTYQQNWFDEIRRAVRIHNHKVVGAADPPEKDPPYPPEPGQDTPVACFAYAFDHEGDPWYERAYPDPRGEVGPGEGVTQAYAYDYAYRLLDAYYRVPDSVVDTQANNTLTNPAQYWNVTDLPHMNYALDDAGNRTKTTYSDMIVGTIETGYQPNQLNQYIKVGDETQVHDGDGNLTDDGSKQMWFDYANRDPNAARVFKIQLDYMQSGSLGYVDPAMTAGMELKL